MLFNPTWFRESSQHQVLPHRKSSRERAKLLAKLFYTNLYYFFTLVFENSVVFLLLNRASFYIFKDEESVRISNSLLIFNKCIYIYIYIYILYNTVLGKCKGKNRSLIYIKLYICCILRE